MKGRRSYTKVLRAAGEEETRQRIVAAMVALHEEVGPARTTVSAIAERAGVERLTVYRHFPDEPSMLRACSTHWNALHPPPPVAIDPKDSLGSCRRMLARLYAWYRSNAAMLTQVYGDMRRIAFLSEVMAPFDDYLDDLAARLEGAWPRRSARRVATIRHALEFSTWTSLDRITGNDRRAAALAASWVETASSK